MGNAECEVYTDEDHVERNGLILTTRYSCEEIVRRGKAKKRTNNFYGTLNKLQKALGFKQTVSFETKVGNEVRNVNITSSTENPAFAEFITIEINGYIERLVLSKEDAFILENWGVGESIYKEEVTTELSGSEEREYVNPRLATLKEIKPYSELVNILLCR